MSEQVISNSNQIISQTTWTRISQTPLGTHTSPCADLPNDELESNINYLTDLFVTVLLTGYVFHS